MARSVPGIVEHLSDEASRLSDIFVHYGTGYNLKTFSYLVQDKRTLVPGYLKLETFVLSQFTHFTGREIKAKHPLNFGEGEGMWGFWANKSLKSILVLYWMKRKIWLANIGRGTFFIFLLTPAQETDGSKDWKKTSLFSRIRHIM